ncbi:hypothetical protein [Pseudoalteromonas sp.]|uniref:hypothetical protein n=1 Tax=Pseudoalteromonas sp. TaxID=53249 RepID=UPI00356703F9
MEAPLSGKLKKLLESTQLLLNSHNNKSQWHTFYPLLCKLSEQYAALYKQNPAALQAQLNLYKTHYSYATNLVVNQCVLTCALCSSQNYDSNLTELYISASLVEHLCVTKQLNKLSQQQTFSETDTKMWQLRHKLAAKILLTAKQPAHQIAHILAKLGKYKHALLDTPKIMLYDGASVLVSLANILALNVTCNEKQQHINFYKAVADLYIRTPNSFAQTLLKALVAHVGQYVPGSQVVYADQAMVYLATDTQGRHIIVNNANTKMAWYRIKASLMDDSKAWECNDNRLFLKVWDSEYLNIPNSKLSAQTSLYQLVKQIKTQKEYSFKALNTLLTPYPDVIKSVCLAVKHYNKELLPAKDLRHSLSMVGYDKAPAIIQGVVFQQLVNSIAHPLHAFLCTRISCLVNILELLVKHNPRVQGERISLSLYAYLYYVLIHYSADVSRKITIDQTPNKSLDTPFSIFFGVNNVDASHLNAELNELLSGDPWASALLNAEQLPKKQLDDAGQLWAALKVVAQRILKPNQPLTAWQQQVLNQQLSRHGWQSEADFNQSLLRLGLHNSI